MVKAYQKHVILHSLSSSLFYTHKPDSSGTRFSGEKSTQTMVFDTKETMVCFRKAKELDYRVAAPDPLS
jgi:hypothetical protein